MTTSTRRRILSGKVSMKKLARLAEKYGKEAILNLVYKAAFNKTNKAEK